MQVGLSSMQHWVGQYKQDSKRVTPLAKALTPEQQRIQVLESEVNITVYADIQLTAGLALSILKPSISKVSRG